ncbi:hypothetical protein ACHHYP_10750 [Achlya hypogyna]|uniref:Uncharacterized protein n=1 Tax=Achlya hypogyna TaxID=1202772 RepID=A0A1V9ZHS3_ACHHY|nr:hypothetical protein ACHHYP_10750 [Achlya hypogyna]
MNYNFLPARFHAGVCIWGLLSYLIYRGRVSADRVSGIAALAVYGAFGLCVLDVLLFHWQARRLVPLVPRPHGVAVVTGASSGIGREIAYLLAEKGFSVVLVARTQATLERMAKEMREVLGVAVHVCPADLSAPTSVGAIEEFVAKEKLEVDILVNCAGIGHHGAFHTQTRNAVDEMVHINVTALVQLTHVFLPGMVARNCGRILNIASIAGASPMPTSAVYGATKAMVTRFSQSINYEMRHKNVGVTNINPGPIPTAFQEKCGMPQAMLFHIPGISNDAKAVAIAGVDAMLAGVETTFDAFSSEVLYYGATALVPKRLIALCGQLLWNPPSAIPSGF